MITNSTTGELMTNLSHQTLHHQVVIPENYQVTLEDTSTRYILVQEPTATTANVPQAEHDVNVKHELPDNDNIDEFLSATNLEDFLWYNCPKCPFKCKTSPNFIEHVVQNHPKAKHVIEDLTLKKHEEEEDIKDLDQHMLDDVENYIQYDINRGDDDSDDTDDSDIDSSEEYQSRYGTIFF